MAVPRANDFLAAYDEGRAHIPIHVASLRMDTTTAFDLYLQVRPDEPLVLYAERNLPFTEEARQRLADNQVEFLYVDAAQESTYRQYLEAHLSAILADETIDAPKKCEILYMSAQGLVKELLGNPRMGGVIDRSKAVVRNTVDLLLAERYALRHLIKTASLNYYTYTHSVNVCVYSVALAQRVGYDMPGFLRELGNGALLHDVGLSQIESSILESAGALTFAQFEVMKRHPELGQELLIELRGVGEAALDVVRHHHEKLNGAGYPDGLSEDAISPRVRTCTIADIFDALTTARPHRKALSSFEALDTMRREMQDELDEGFLRAFIDMMGNPDS